MAHDIQQDRIYAHARYTFFYDLELDGFDQDLDFYRRHLPGDQCRVLELGCGTGRVGRVLAAEGHTVVGIDLSQPMLVEARAKENRNKQQAAPSPWYACMDMTRLGIRGKFDAVIIPNNTMNLLVSPGQAEDCLAGLMPLLKADGRLLFQVYVPDDSLLALDGKKQFQFRIFNLEDGAKVIKEVLKGVARDAAMIDITETFRLRFRPDLPNEDWRYQYQILGYDAARWQNILDAAGFGVEAAWGDYSLTPFRPGQDSILLFAARRADKNSTLSP